MSLPSTVLRIAVTGASGFVGTALDVAFREAGHQVVRIGRKARAPGDVTWDPSTGRLAEQDLAGVDVAVNLAGENISARRWTPQQKQRILESRVEGTRLLSRRLASLRRPPRLLLSGSAVGWYGPQDDVVDESTSYGEGFLAEVCHQWEAATLVAREAGIRVVHFRLGIVLSRHGGALPRMLPPFRMGLGGVTGSGRQAMSWVHLDDVVGAAFHILATESLQGPVNVVAPELVDAAVFARTLARVLRRPALFPLPSLAVRLLLGEMGEALLLQGAPAYPSRLVDSGYSFRHPVLEDALRAELQS